MLHTSWLSPSLYSYLYWWFNYDDDEIGGDVDDDDDDDDHDDDTCMLKGYDTNYDDKIAPAKPVACVLPLEEVQQSIELRTRLRRCFIRLIWW